jgi:membrane-associated protease RseP (regulator of RpoE activity)
VSTVVVGGAKGDQPVPSRDDSGSPVPDDRRSNRWALARLLAVVAAGLLLAILLNGLPVLVVVLALVVMVMVHELGHFITAKLSGMKVTEYFLGFGPRIWSIRRGETSYGVKAVPAGGYVRIVGMTMLEEVDPADEARSFRQATFPRRILVAVAGSAMHFIMAFVLLWALLSFSGLPVAAVPEVTGLTNFVGAKSPAALAGFKPGDVIVAIDGHQFSQAQQYVDFVKSHPGTLLTVVVRRGSRDVTLHVRPDLASQVKELVNGKATPATVTSGPGTGVIGVTLDFLTRNETTNPFVAIGRATTLLGSVTASTASGIAQVFSLHGLHSFAHQVSTAGSSASKSSSSSTSSGSGSSASGSSSNSSGQLLSIIGAIQIGAQAARQNISELLYILVAINIFVGMVNLFPMLPLDGGHVVIAVYERIRSRRGRRYHADVAKLMPVAYVFLLFMVVLGVGALYANIVQPASLPGG